MPTDHVRGDFIPQSVAQDSRVARTSADGNLRLLPNIADNFPVVEESVVTLRLETDHHSKALRLRNV